jgi:hypothetical protein
MSLEQNFQGRGNNCVKNGKPPTITDAERKKFLRRYDLENLGDPNTLQKPTSKKTSPETTPRGFTMQL